MNRPTDDVAGPAKYAPPHLERVVARLVRLSRTEPRSKRRPEPDARTIRCCGWLYALGMRCWVCLRRITVQTWAAQPRWKRAA